MSVYSDNSSCVREGLLLLWQRNHALHLLFSEIGESVWDFGNEFCSALNDLLTISNPGEFVFYSFWLTFYIIP
jgi:hypothetical protein